MKKYQYITIIFMLFLLHLNTATAQFTNTGGGNWNTSVATVDRISIGTTGSNPTVLFVDGANTTGSNTGNVFSTNGPSATTTNWKMSQNGTETFRVENAASVNTVALGTMQSARFDIFTNGTGNPRVSVTSGGIVGIGITTPSNLLTISNSGSTGGGSAPSVASLLVVGGNSGMGAADHVAEFRSSASSSNSIGIAIRGARGTSSNVEAAFLDFLNYDNSNSRENNLARISADQRSYTNRSGYLRFFVNNTSNVLRSAMMIDNDGSVGIGFNTFQASQPPARRLEVYEDDNNPQVRISHDVSANPIYTDLQTTSSGNFYIHPVTSTGADGNVGIGISSPTALFHVEKTYSTASANNYLSRLYLNNSGAGSLNYGSDIYMSSTGSGSTVTGQFIFASGLSDNNVIGGYYTAGVGASNYGLIASAQQGEHDYGVFAQAQYGDGDVYGVWAEATNNGNNGDLQGVHAEANDDGGTHTTVYGIYAGLNGSSGSCSSPYNTTDCPKAAGYFSGDLVYSGAIYGTSDANLKDNVLPIQNASAILTQLMPKSFTYKTIDFPSMNLSQGPHYGLISQEVENVLYNIVKKQRQPAIKDSLGNIITPQVDYKSVNYIELITILIQGFKEQQLQLMDMQIQLDNCCNVPKGNNSNDERTGQNEPMNVKLLNAENCILYANEPNPYTSSTTIRYFIPENTSDVKITFQDAMGKTLKEVPVNETGQGSIKVDGSELISGIYTYSLVIGNKIVDTKKMVKQ